MDKKEIIIKADMDDMGHISSVIQSRKGDFLSIDQEGINLVVIARIPNSEYDFVKEDLEKLLGKNFKIDVYKKK